MRHLYLIAYDIADHTRLRQALHIARDYALGSQKSVHECWLNAAERREVETRFDDLIEPLEDRYFILGLDPRSTVELMGIAVPPADPRWFYIG